MRYAIIFAVMMSFAVCASASAQSVQPQPQAPAAEDSDKSKEKHPKDLDLVTDVVADVFSKANALMTGNLEITMEGRDKTIEKTEYEYNAIGQKVPKSTAMRAGRSLEN